MRDQQVPNVRLLSAERISLVAPDMLRRQHSQRMRAKAELIATAGSTFFKNAEVEEKKITNIWLDAHLSHLPALTFVLWLEARHIRKQEGHVSPSHKGNRDDAAQRKFFPTPFEDGRR